MKHGSTTAQKLVKAIRSDLKLISEMSRLWHPHFGAYMVFCLSTILRKVKPLTATIRWHYWIDWAQKSRKNGLACKRKKCCSTKTMHHDTNPWKRWSIWMNEASNCFLTHHTLQIWPLTTTGSLLTWKKCSRERDLASMNKWLPKQMVVRRNNVWRVWRVGYDLPFQRFQVCLYWSCDMSPSIIMLEDNFQLLSIPIPYDGFTRFQ